MQQTHNFQILIVLSSLPVAKKRPVGSKATDQTELLCPAKVATQVAAAPSGDMRHTLAVLSPLPVATKRPVGSKATDQTSPALLLAMSLREWEVFELVAQGCL